MTSRGDLKAFRNREVGIISEMEWRSFAVLVPLVKTEDGLAVLFEERSSKLNTQPDEVSFPGGAVEAGESYEEAAVRETMEELLVQREQIKVLGPSDILINPSAKKIHPYLAILEDYDGSFHEAEVKSTFLVPLSFFKEEEPKIYRNKLILDIDKDFPHQDVPNGFKYRWDRGEYQVMFYYWEDKVIWGLTARMLKATLELMEEYGLCDSFGK